MTVKRALGAVFGPIVDRFTAAEQALLLGAGLMLEVNRRRPIPEAPQDLIGLPAALWPRYPTLAEPLDHLLQRSDAQVLGRLEEETGRLLGVHGNAVVRAAAHRFGEALDVIPSDREHFSVMAPVARLLAGTVPLSAGMSVLDPTCGSGRVLVAVGERLRAAGAEGFQLHGAEVRPVHAALASLNLLLHGFKDATVEVGDAPTDRAWDAVVSVPPLGVPPPAHWTVVPPHLAAKLPDNPEFAHLHGGLAQLRPDGQVSVLLPAGVLFRRQDAEFRQWLAETGLIRAAAAFPTGLIRRVSLSFALLVVSNRSESDPIRLVDAAGTRKKTAEPLGDGGVEDVLKALQGGSSPLPTVQVELGAQRDQAYSWLVSTYQQPQRRAASPERLHQELQDAQKEVGRAQKQVAQKMRELDRVQGSWRETDVR